MNEIDLEKDKTRDSSEAVMQNSQEDVSQEEVSKSVEPSKTQAEVEKLVDNDMNVIRTLMGIGLITREQGQDLMKQVISNAYSSITKQHVEPSVLRASENSGDKKSFIDAFIAENAEFFGQAGREDVLSYLKKSNVDFDKDELLQISQLIEAVEKAAIDRYLKKVEYGKTLNDENIIAKQRLAANASSRNVGDNNRVFTRAQIGKMSGDEFAKYETAIMEQLRKGLIK